MPFTFRNNGPSSPRPGFRSGRPGRQRVSGVQRFPSWLNRNRRLLVALLLCAAAGSSVQQLTPAPAHTVTALASARDLPAGTALSSNEVVRVEVPPGMVPAGAFADTAAIVGKQLAGPLRKGQLISDTQLLGPGLLAGTPPGSAAVPLRMADPSSIQLVAPGQLVNIVMTNGSDYGKAAESQVLAASVPVLWTSGQGGQTGPWPGTGETEGLIVVAADPDQARALAGSSTQGKLFFVMVGAQG